VKVVYVSTLDRGGPLVHVEALARHMASAGADVHVICASEGVATRLSSAGVEASLVPLRHKLDVGRAATVWPLLRAADVVHTHDRRAGLLVRSQAPLRRAAVFHTFHGVPEELCGEVGADGTPAPYPGASRLRKAWLRHGLLGIEAVLARLGTTIVPSRAMAAFVVRYGFSPKRIAVIPNGIDVRRLDPGPVHTPTVLMTSALLEYRKGIDVLLAACAQLDEPFELHVLGDGSERAALERQAAELGIPASFHGFVDDVRARLETADLFVLPTRGENFPIAILEAMAAALPVVCTRIGGNPELVDDGVTGLLVAVNDVTALRRALASLIADPARRVELGRNGAYRVSQQFEIDAIARRMLALYRRAAQA
jgi:glycosyltransferase involved in cell wall biosynthesis